jgi:hypothetical protein
MALSQPNEISKKRLKSFKAHPHWITMTQDSNVNYLEAKIAFETFWNRKPCPESILEGETENESEERNIFQRIIKSDKAYKADIVQYASEYKKFKFWLREKSPYVKPDGFLMTDKEMQSLIEQELKNREIIN